MNIIIKSGIFSKSGILIDGIVYYMDSKIKNVPIDEFGKSTMRLQPIIKVDDKQIINRIEYYIKNQISCNSHEFVMRVCHDSFGAFPTIGKKLKDINNNHNFVRING